MASEEVGFRLCFVSYNARDEEFARRLADDLLRANIPVWIATWDIDAGESVTGAIERAISTADVFIVVLSPASVAARWVRRELEVALYRSTSVGDMRIIPVLLEDCTIPDLIRDLRYVDFRDPGRYDERFDQLAGSILGRRRGPGVVARTPRGYEVATAILADLDADQIQERIDAFQGMVRRNQIVTMLPVILRVVKPATEHGLIQWEYIAKGNAKYTPNTVASLRVHDFLAEGHPALVWFTEFNGGGSGSLGFLYIIRYHSEVRQYQVASKIVIDGTELSTAALVSPGDGKLTKSASDLITATYIWSEGEVHIRDHKYRIDCYA